MKVNDEIEIIDISPKYAYSEDTTVVFIEAKNMINNPFLVCKADDYVIQCEYIIIDTNKEYCIFNTMSYMEREKLIRDKIVTSEFYIRGYEAKKFIIDESKIQDTAYMRFVWLTKIVLNLKR